MGKRLLIVDDSAMMRKLLSRALKPPHEIVGEAKNGLEALALYKELKPDLVTMDITMQGMDGLTAAREILRFDGDAKILFLSNLDEEKIHNDLESLGAVGFVNKHKSKEIIGLLDDF